MPRIWDRVKEFFGRPKAPLPPALEVAQKIQSAKAVYNALEFDGLRKPPAYRPQRTETQQVFLGGQHVRSLQLGDRLFDNHFSYGSQVLTLKRLAVGAKGGRPFFAGAKAKELQKRWDSWAAKCGHQEDESFSEILGLCLIASQVHGDCLVLCHKELTNGKVRLFDADQITNIADFQGWCAERGLHAAEGESDYGYRQCAGCVLDPEGRVEGYFVSYLRAMEAVPNEAATFLSADICRRIGLRTKLSQYRGESSALPLEELEHDTNSLIKSEIQAAQNAATYGLGIIRPPAGGDAMSAAIKGAVDPNTGMIREDVADLLPYGDDPRQLIKDTVEQPANLDQIEGKSAIASFPHGTTIQEFKNDQRPSTSVLDWLQVASDFSGQRMGLQSALSRGKVETSFASGQLELAVSWTAVEESRAMLEKVVDYCVSVICPDNEGYRVQWPDKIQLDPEKHQKVIAEQLRTGIKSYQDILGPSWRENLWQIKEVLDFIKEIGLPKEALSWLTETGAGNSKNLGSENGENEGEIDDEN